MKIGILTFHRALNYGAVLQCYGLSETLKSLGHHVEIIDYRPKYIERYRHIIPFFELRHTKGLVNKIKTLISSILSTFYTLDANKRFDDFLEKHFSFSEITHTPNEVPQTYDMIIIGSDQIWSPQICYGFDPVYWGQFSHRSTKLITYAASLGGHNKLTSNEWEKVKTYLTVFDSISVREKQLQIDLQEKLGLITDLVADPTILAEKSIFENIAVRPKYLPDNYILVFSVAPNDNLMRFSELVAVKTNSKIVILNAKKSSFTFHNKHKHKEINPTIEEFLGAFKFAKCIVTVSFHGTVFSVLFRKDFYSLHNYMVDRTQNFLEEIGLSHRLISNEYMKNFHYNSVDYNIVEEKIANLKKPSFEFIKNNLATFDNPC